MSYYNDDSFAPNMHSGGWAAPHMHRPEFHPRKRVCSFVLEGARQEAAELLADPEGFHHRRARLHATRVVDALASLDLNTPERELHNRIVIAILGYDPRELDETIP